jgi:hypothetical protein
MTDYFLPSFGNRPQHLVGRETVVESFLSGLSKPVGHPVRATLYIGQRGMGKTALLLEFSSRAVALDYVVARVTASNNMLDEIVQTIQNNGAKYVQKRKSVGGFNVGALGFSFGLTFNDETERKYGFRIKLTLLADELAKYGKGILILVDEVDGNSSQMRELAITYQHLVGDNKNIAIAMAGLPSSISAVLNDKVLTFLNRANKVTLGPLPLNDVAVYYHTVFTELGKRIDADTIDSMTEATKGYPYLLQLIGYYTLEYAGAGELIGKDISDKAINSAKRAMIDNVFLASLSPLSARDREFLNAMSKDTDVSAIADIQKRLGVSQASVQQTRARLLDAQVIAAAGRGYVTITIPYLGEYLRGKF